MESVVLVDCNIFIGLLREGRDPAVELLNRRDLVDLATCGIVRLGVIHGIIQPKARKLYEAFFDVMQNVISDDRLWRDATDLAWQLQQKGVTLPSQDILIAASALRINAIVLTADKHFDLVPDLKVYHSLEELR